MREHTSGAKGYMRDTADLGFYAPVLEDASVEAKAKIKDLQAQLVKMKSEKNV